jgi:hypothetical protein
MDSEERVPRTGTREAQRDYIILLSWLALLILLVLALLLQLLLFQTKLPLLMNDLHRPLLQLRESAAVFRTVYRIFLHRHLEVLENRAVFLLLIFGEASQLSEIVSLQKLHFLLLRRNF